MKFNKISQIFADQKGFTLLELLLSVLILAIIITAFAPIITFTAQNFEYNRAKMTAVKLANKKMEEIRSLSFGDIGTIGGNPAGAIPPLEEVKVGRHTFLIETYVNWIEEGGCLSGQNADWDYKQVRITVTCPGFFYQGKQTVREELSSLFARDSEQPAMTGANLRVCVFRAWGAGLNPNTGEFDQNSLKPVSGVKVTANSIHVHTTLKGSALFLGLNPGNYTVNIDPSARGFIIFPGSYPKNDISVTNGNTVQLFGFVEEPCSLKVFLKTLNEAPVHLSLSSGQKAKLALLQPYGDQLVHEFTSTSSNGEIPNHPFFDLWPVGAGFAGLYSFDKDLLHIPGYVSSGLNGEHGAFDKDINQAWHGDFLAPGTRKNLIIYLIKIPDADNAPGADPSWTNGNSPQIKHNNNLLSDRGIAFETVIIDPEAEPPMTMHILKPCNFRTEHNSDELVLSTGSPQYTASELYFTNKKLTISAQSELKLKSNLLVFNSEVILEKHKKPSKDGKLTLNVITGNVPYDNTYVSIYDQNGTPVIKKAADGSEIEDYKGNKGISGRKYGEVYFSNDVKDNRGNILIKKGAYYFPDGFELPGDANKSPAEGGLLRK
ncbi:carboxypeptidase-like regulatory domain-containing protein [Thermosyntropha sp.]|uniref:carboxypeptidase-like regulatory domain-containing protein n=1 Tax=Thermosyntropha sp. TaxID=2740820 RepID=UPI0025F3115E|nr:carboxypeptidase-like regulatory domain-containing protein [Thermosyntropha sp.]MBO8159243.1 carboxypeptidase regulatory-like domain-containing protein [Thermosyntropha sp.]